MGEMRRFRTFPLESTQLNRLPSESAPVIQARLTFQNSGPVNSNFPARLLR